MRRGERFVRKGVVVRVETLCKSRYEGPHYVVFAKEPVERGEDGDASRRLEIVHHTLPPWVPLRELATKYLGVKVRGDDALGEEGGVADLVSPDHAPDFDLFLSRLSTLLNATLSRRRQFLALRTTYSCEEFAALDLRVFNNESSDRAVVEWDLATVEGGDEQDSDNIARDRLVVVQLAFRDLASEALELLDDVLVRCVSRSPESGQAPAAKAVSIRFTRGDAQEKRTVGEVIGGLVKATMVAGWLPHEIVF